MSKIRNIVPIALATTIGIANGLWVFGPAFEEQKQQKESLDKHNIETPRTDNSNELLPTTEATASTKLVPEPAMVPTPESNSWWQTTSFWTPGDAKAQLKKGTAPIQGKPKTES